jgi:hypothetical protein
MRAKILMKFKFDENFSQDDENNFAQEIEERLYAEIYHDSNVESANDSVQQDNSSTTTTTTTSSNNKARYWQDSKRKKPNFVSDLSLRKKESLRVMSFNL